MTSFTTRLMQSGFVVLLMGAATPASADWLLTPYLGVTFGSGVEFADLVDFGDFEKKTTYGGTLTWMGAGIVGFEADFGVTPDFFELPTGPIDIDFGDTNVTTLMGNVVVGAPIGGTSGPGFRPYGSVGLGLLRSRIDASDLFDDVDSNELGINLGGGAHIFFSDSIGIRGDLRYFRSLQDDGEDLIDLDLGSFDFWRATVGVTFRFGG